MTGYSMYDDDPQADVEALEAQRFDADLEMAEMDAIGNAIARARRAGRCTHGSAAGYHHPPIYPEQEGLQPGQLRCTEHTGGCQRVFSCDDDWYQAMDEAVYG